VSCGCCSTSLQHLGELVADLGVRGRKLRGLAQSHKRFIIAQQLSQRAAASVVTLMPGARPT
jgi:hypothetical protein